ncbi:MBL fold metallo-hydrolase [Oceanobacillus jeddahense]|uniref:MBL fold metallo-hydrolase n=1 Tax=Oceanobacillus jeddahense TaxID=1462527 RepID=A0ABY5K2F7_9BACI|nr:MBL fold metallo-hydrolase [Oceanobacillus jeddahense]UUI05486.1 MBL fold metallo-hydrolase [Oceanobacillus jeddahense]
MHSRKPMKLHHSISLIDGFDFGVSGRTGSYIIEEDELTIVETGPSPAVPYIKKGLEELGYTFADVKHIIVTHVHLDHAGGAGRLLELCPNAILYVHPKGKRHLVDPKKLAAGARAIYGERFSELYDPIVPAAEERIVEKTEGDILQIGEERVLEFWDTPGHARHHLGIYDRLSNGMFTGDTAGIQYEQLFPHGVNFFLPSTSPNHFDPDAMRHSLQRFREKQLDYIYFGHFGETDLVEEALDRAGSWLDIFVKEAETAFAKGQSYDEIAESLLKYVQAELREQGIADDHEVYQMIHIDLQLSALGMIDYLQKK